MKTVNLREFTIGGNAPVVLIAGPCVIESERIAMEIAGNLKAMTGDIGMPFIFKASYDKANRTSVSSYRGPGMERGLEILERIRNTFEVPVLSDVHRFEEIDAAARVLDVIQIPAFLCRQTDFISAVARTGRIVNVKKGQFMAPWDIKNVIDKIRSAGNEDILITERGTTFGYNNLVADMRALPMMRRLGWPVVFDATHSVQLPGGEGNVSGGDREMALCLSRAATAVGIDGLFIEVHPDPDSALCDGPNSLRMDSLPSLLRTVRNIDAIAKGSET